MNITWLGQAGLLFQSETATVMIDPYLSNSVKKVQPQNNRRVPIDEHFFDVSPDVMIFTHNHLDHFDPETAPRFLSRTGKQMTVLCPTSVFAKAKECGGGHNYVQFDRGTEWTQGDLRFTAVPAAHSDPFAIGVLIEDLGQGKCYYVTGDTLYHHKIFDDLPTRIDAVFLPINGVGNNMNLTDAARFADRIRAARTVPIHFGMFDDIDPTGLKVAHCVIPRLYEEFTL